MNLNKIFWYILLMGLFSFVFVKNIVHAQTGNKLFQVYLSEQANTVRLLNSHAWHWTACLGNLWESWTPYRVGYSICVGTYPSQSWVWTECTYEGNWQTLCAQNWCGQSEYCREASQVADNVLISRNYIDQYLSGTETVNSYIGALPDLSLVTIPDDEYPHDALLLNEWTCGAPENGYKAAWADLCTGQIFYTGKGICNDAVYDCLEGSDFTECIAPTPTPTIAETPTPTATEIITSTQTPNPTPTPEGWTPTPTPYPEWTPTTQPTANPTVTANPLSDGPIETIERESVLEKYFISTQNEELKIEEINNQEYTEEVPDVGQSEELEWTWLDDMLATIGDHPIIAVITGSALTSEAEVCELSCVIFGQEISFSFCEYTWFFEYLGYFILGFAVYYSIIIVFLKGS